MRLHFHCEPTKTKYFGDFDLRRCGQDVTKLLAARLASARMESEANIARPPMGFNA